MPTKYYWQQLMHEVQQGFRLILLGEIHGAQVNPHVLDVIVRRLNIQFIMIELEPKWQKIFPLLLSGRAQEFIDSLKQEDWLVQTGLIGQEHVQLFKRYLSEGKQIVPVKINHQNWNVSERRTFDMIKRSLRQHPNTATLVVFGNLHTRKRPFYLHMKPYDFRYVPLGYRLRKQAVSVRIRYGWGQVYNFRPFRVQDEYASRYIRKNGEGLVRSRSPYYDYDYMISKTEPLRLL